MEKLCDSLQKDFEACMDQAEKDNDMNLVVKTNALKRARAEKLNDTKKLDETIEILNEKRKKLV